jgi:autotransporter-associated beta strand protein
MQTRLWLCQLCARFGCVVLLAGLIFSPVHATSDSWSTPASGTYSTTTNWLGGNVPNAASDHADFSLLDLAGDVSVTLDQNITLGQLSFGDTDLLSAGSWELKTDTANTITLNNGASKPVIRVNALTPTTFDDAYIGPALVGTTGFSKVGAGIATIGGVATVTGGIQINEGTLRVSNTIPAQTFTIANGATLNPKVSMDAVGTRIFSVASGATANLSIEGSVEVGRFDAVGANINVNFPTTAAAGARFTPSGNWLASGASNNPATFVVNSQGAAPTPVAVPSVSTEIPQTGAVVRLAPNNSSASGGIRNFNANTFATTAVTLNNTLLYSRTNSGGNTFNFGSLTGDATAILSGGNQGAFATYSIGALNTSTTFAGTMDVATSTGRESTGANTGGLNLTKVGTGTLTLSGTLAYQPTANGTVNRRGGITTVSAGTLALTNSAAIPGGINDGTVGVVLSTVNILGGATLNVSGYSGSYSTAALQQVVGAGTIVGNYTHDEGIIRPANTISGTTASGTSPSVATAGTINFANNFTWSGGEVTFDLTLDPNTGNDLVSVAGATTLSGGLIKPNFLAGIPISGTYTVLTSGSISGTASSITVDWPGRSADPVPYISGNSLKFDAPGISSASLTWTGSNVTNPTYWDVETTSNWTGATPNLFFQSDNVRFDDTATGYTVDIRTNVQPSSVVVDNTTNYTIMGTGGIGGAATLTKTGTGRLTMTTANLFSGAASVTGGSVDIGSANGALGTGQLTLTNTYLIAANTASVGLTNSGLVSAGTSNTIEVNGTVANPFGLPATSGSGDITLTSTVVGKIIDLGTNNGFTGDLNVIGATDLDGVDPLVTTNTTIVRMNAAGSSLPDSTVTLTNGASLRDRATSVQTLTLGALAGDATATLYGYQGGSGATARTWRIGALNTNTTFAGVIQDSTGSSSTTAPVTLVKIGTGELELTGVNIYTGNTTVEAGTLSITNAYLADAADVSVLTGAILDLNFGSLSTIDIIDELFLNGAPQQAGTWGRIGSGAAHESSYFTGDGLLQVTTYNGLPGDFDNDGDVDGQDFLVWQRNPGVGSLTDWSNNYGLPLVAASSANLAAVPEPAAALLTLVGGLALLSLRKRG